VATTFVIKKLKDLKTIVKESQGRTITRRIQDAGLLPKPRQISPSWDKIR
jgi:hypothetical protein